MSVIKMAFAMAAMLTLSACGPTWSTAEVARPTSTQADASGAPVSVAPPTQAQETALPKTDPAKVLLTEADITDRPYKALGDIAVTVNKTTIFHPDPTREMVAQRLREEAAAMGADAVVLVRYGTVSLGLMSWGTIDGRGRAVSFVRN